MGKPSFQCSNISWASRVSVFPEEGFLPIQRRVFKGEEEEEEEEEVLFLVVGCRRTGEYKKRGEGEREK